MPPSSKCQYLVLEIQVKGVNANYMKYGTYRGNKMRLLNVGKYVVIFPFFPWSYFSVMIFFPGSYPGALQTCRMKIFASMANGF